ncbi:MAG: response regulator [Gammaproteobacteria bacterium]|nr:response regulator [Gammaproteobacteria bacterium]
MKNNSCCEDVEKNLKLTEQIRRLVRSELRLYETRDNLEQQLQRINLLNDFGITIVKAKNLDEVLTAAINLLSDIFITYRAVGLFFDFTNKTLTAKVRKIRGAVSEILNIKLPYFEPRAIGITSAEEIITLPNTNKSSLLNFATNICPYIFEDGFNLDTGAKMLYVFSEDETYTFASLLLFCFPPQDALAFGEKTPKDSDYPFINLVSKYLNSITRNLFYHEKLLTFTAELEKQVTLRTAELKTKAEMLDNTLESIYVNDMDGKFVWMNEVMWKTRGYTQEELMATNLHQLVVHKYENMIMKRINDIPDNSSILFESAHFKKNGEIMPVEVQARFITMEGKKYVFCSTRDISERKKTEAELEKYREHLEELVKSRTQDLETEIKERIKATEEMKAAKEAADLANRAKSVFLTNVSHEIRTPMNAILGYSQLLQHDENLTPTEREYINTINSSGDHLLALINDVLEMSRIESGKIQIIAEGFDFHLMLSDIERMFAVRAQEKNLSFEVTRNSGVPRYLISDLIKIRQVVINLIGNAIKFTECGEVKIITSCSPLETESNKVNLKITVSDTGIGIPENEYETIFNAFEQVQTRNTMERGSGLGLTISKRYARLLGGDITFTSMVGKGSTFVFTFKAELATEASIQTQNVVPQKRVLGIATEISTPTILVVDDNEPNRKVLQILLQRVGFKTIEASNGQEAIELFKQKQPDLILMDLRMPGLDGIETTKLLRRLPGGSSVRILMVTASALEDAKKKVLQAGVDGFIRKPYKESELFEQIRQHLNVKYSYAATSESLDGKVSLEDVSDELLHKIPSSLVNALLDAAEDGNISMLLSLITQELSKIDSRLSNIFGYLAKQYDYQKIIKLLERTKLG